MNVKRLRMLGVGCKHSSRAGKCRQFSEHMPGTTFRAAEHMPGTTFRAAVHLLRLVMVFS
jgi:hypothetical protein